MSTNEAGKAKQIVNTSQPEEATVAVSISESEQRIFVNEWGEFWHGCLCGGNDFYPVEDRDGQWFEVEGEPGNGWACISCLRIFTADGRLIKAATDIAWLEI
ncbi:hypothetical protein [Nocardia brasiliensis]|uniref:hypothetical protein n=1 Tax=Nocardia brasiliensis TaxID=37326 RepID=UPI003D8F9E51